jgi:hypothetical protein
MRPKTIVYFERIIFGTLLLAVLQVYLSWDRIKAFGNPPDRDLQAVIYLIVLIVMSALVGTLTVLVSRRRSKISMWVSIGLFAISFAVFVLDIVDDIIRARLPSEHIMRA